MTNNKQLNENEIRPSSLMADQKIAVLKDVAMLLGEREKFVSVNCPACESSEYRKKFIKYGLDYVECTQCETFYISPRPTDETLGKFYANSVNYEYWNKYIFPASEESRRKKIFVPRVDSVIDYCKKYNVEPNSILEVGAAFGTFCSEMLSRNYFKKVVGIEPTPNLAQTCRDKGITVIEKPIEQVTFNDDEKFDVVVNFEVIEHLFSPIDFITKCKKLLRKGGLFIVTCPNGKGFDISVLGNVSDTVDHEHLNYFNPESLGNLLKNCGFEILDVKTPGKLDAELVRNKCLSGDFSLENQPFLKEILLDEWERVGEMFQNFIRESGMSSNMWIIAKNL